MENKLEMIQKYIEVIPYKILGKPVTNNAH